MSKMSFTLAIVAGAFGLWLPAGSSSAQTFELTQTLLNPSPGDGDFFGFSLAVSGNNLLVGSPRDSNQEASISGAAYLFDATTGDLLQTFLNPSPGELDFVLFGTSVAMSGNNVLVGSPNDDNQGELGSGAAYLFDATTGDLLQTLLNPSPGDDDQFGTSVAMSGNNVLVGSPFDDNQGELGSGAAYLFDATTGDLLQTFLNPTPGDFDTFGNSVAVSGNNLFVGSSNDDNQGEFGRGAVYLFDATTGDLLQTFLSPSPGSSGAFGVSVAVSGNNLLVGSPGDSSQGVFASGAAYLFDATTGDLLQTFLNPTPGDFVLFGTSVAVSGNNLLVGSPNDDNQGAFDSGAAYLFDATTGDLLQTFLNPTPGDFELFGNSVAMSENNLLVGSPFDSNQGASQSGVAYLFQPQSTKVPEPDSLLALLAVGVLGATTLHRLRHRAS